MTTTLLTGMPRSGTTLLCALLNDLPDTIALAEPMRVSPHGDVERALVEVDAFVACTRADALAGKSVRSGLVGGAITDNWAEAPRPDGGLRKSRMALGTIRVTKPLTPDFHLFIKHPALFSGLAPRLRERYPMVALVRHPLAALAAWQTVAMPVGHGRLPMAEAFRPELRAALDVLPDALSRQVKLIEVLLSWYAQMPASQVLRYEDLVADPQGVLARIAGNAGRSELGVHAYDLEQRYPGVDLGALARALTRIGPVAERFYPQFLASLAPHLAR